MSFKRAQVAGKTRTRAVDYTSYKVLVHPSIHEQREHAVHPCEEGMIESGLLLQAPESLHKRIAELAKRRKLEHR